MFDSRTSSCNIITETALYGEPDVCEELFSLEVLLMNYFVLLDMLHKRQFNFDFNSSVKPLSSINQFKHHG